MKEFIAVIASVLIIMVIIMQFTTNVKNHAYISYANKCIHNSKEIAKQEGYFSQDNINNLKSEIAEYLNLSANEITVIADGLAARKLRGEFIHYKVIVPIKNVIAAPKFWRISESSNQAEHVVQNVTTSEYLP